MTDLLDVLTALSVLIVSGFSSFIWYMRWKRKVEEAPKKWSVITYTGMGILAGIVVLALFEGGRGVPYWGLLVSAITYGLAAETLLYEMKHGFRNNKINRKNSSK